MHAEETAVRIHEAGIIAIIRGEFSTSQLLATATALLSGGVSVLEVTLNTSHALEGIKQLRRRLAKHALIGAGTVRTRANVDAALDAGAQFIISPNLDLASVACSQERKVLHLPGIFTASEAQAAHCAGCKLLKLFPADALGPSYLKALSAPLDDIGFVPTGGIDANNLAAYARAGAVAFGVGSSLVQSPEQEPAELQERAVELVAALRKVREGDKDG